MFSDNIIERTQAVQQLLTIDWMVGYFIAVFILMIFCRSLSKWL